MLLKVIPMFCFGFLRIFGENLQKRKTEKSRQNRLLRRSVGCLAAARPRCQIWHPSGTPHRVVATVHKGQNFGFLFQTPRIRTPIV